MSNLLKNVKLTRIANDAVAGTTTVTSSVLDMTGFDGVLFIALLGDITTTCVLTLTALGNTANSTSSPTPVAISGAVVGPITAGATDNDNGVYLLDVYRPLKRYIYVTLARGTANAVVDGIIAIQYKASTKPTVQDVTTILQAVQAVGS